MSQCKVPGLLSVNWRTSRVINITYKKGFNGADSSFLKEYVPQFEWIFAGRSLEDPLYT